MYKKCTLLFISFFLVAFGQPAWIPLCGPLAALLGYALLWVFLDDCIRKSRHFWSASLWFFSVQLVQLSWMTSIKYQGLYIIGVYLLLSAFLGLQFALLTKFALSRNFAKISSAFAVASLGTLLEWMRLFLLSGFSFNFSGLTLACYITPMQFASVFGILGLSFLVWLTNSLAFRAYKERLQSKSLLPWIALGVFPYLFGMLSLTVDSRREEVSHPLRIVLVQPALSPSEKMTHQKYLNDFVSPYVQWQQIFAYVMPYQARGIDLIVLPESVVPFGIDACIYSLPNAEVLESFLGQDLSPYFPELELPFAEYQKGEWYVSNSFWAQTLANFAHSEIIAGFDQHDKLVNESYNAAFHFVPGSKKFERYEKQVLLPLAESLPWGFLKTFTKSYGITEFFTPGLQSKVVGNKCNAGVSICIEETFPEIMREARNKGAEVFVNVSNDAWYPRSNLPLQHFTHSRVRAVENGIPLIRACNTGVTSVVNAQGEMVCGLKPETWFSEADKGAIYKTIYIKPKHTLYSFWGDAGIVALSLIILAWVIKSKDEGVVF